MNHESGEAAQEGSPMDWRKPVEKKAVLRARARQLAQVPAGEREAAGLLAVVEFNLASERYALENAVFREVFPVKDLTTLPCTPPFVLGIINVRGQILSVLDLRKFFDLPIQGLTDLNKVIILQSEHMQVGLITDAVLGVRQIPLSDIQTTLPTLSGVRSEFLRGVTSDRLVILDAAKLLTDERIVVHEEIEP